MSTLLELSNRFRRLAAKGIFTVVCCDSATGTRRLDSRSSRLDLTRLDSISRRSSTRLVSCVFDFRGPTQATDSVRFGFVTGLDPICLVSYLATFERSARLLESMRFYTLRVAIFCEFVFFVTRLPESTTIVVPPYRGIFCAMTQLSAVIITFHNLTRPLGCRY